MSLESYYRLDINIISFLVLSIFLYLAVKRLDLSDKLNRWYVYISSVILLQILIETSTVLMNRIDTSFFITMSYILHTMLFIIGPICAYAWFYFMVYYVINKDEVLFIIKLISKILLFISITFSILSPINGWIFSVSEGNVYMRGPLFIYFMSVPYIYLLAATTYVYIYRNRVLKQEKPLLYIYGLLPIVGGVAQILVYGVLLVWSSIAFTLVFAYVFLIERTTQIDYLSQAITRESFFRNIDRQIARSSQDNYGMVFLDMNKLKKINDEFGHSEGDIAIQNTVRLIKECLNNNEWVVRMGGDEFLIVLNIDNHDLLQSRINDINKSFDDYNHNSNKPYKLSFSYGADIFKAENYELEAFIRKLDQQMYLSKNSNIS